MLRLALVLVVYMILPVGLGSYQFGQWLRAISQLDPRMYNIAYPIV